MPPDPLEGRVVGGAYLLHELVGVGGMGRVYRAEQQMLGRSVAVKVIHPHLLSDDETVARFYTEARAASRLNHPDSVGIIDFGRTDDGILYLVMEYLEGKDLAHVIAADGPLPFTRICRITRHVLSALSEAHSLGVVHRDLKPENIFLRESRRGAEQIKVVDFGLAHLAGLGGTSQTMPGLVCGTPDYMSPEQGKGEFVDGRGDLYSVGVVLFEMLTDRLPFEDESPTKVVFKHIHDPIPDPRAVAPSRGIPEQLALVCMKALQKKADARFQSADEFYEAVSYAALRLAAEQGEARRACGSCGASNPIAQPFCGACGARRTGTFSLPAAFRSHPPPSRTSQIPPAASPLVGRSSELERLLELREVAASKSVWVSITGEPGVGKTRLMNELGQRMELDGDLLVLASPHPSGALLPYFAVKTVLYGLLDADERSLASVVSTGIVGDPLARAGIDEALSPRGLPGRPGESRAEAVAVALATAVQVAAGRSESGRVAVLVDDLSRCDALSREAFRLLCRRLHDGPLLLVSTSRELKVSLDERDSVMEMSLVGLETREALAVLRGEAVEDHPSEAEHQQNETVRPERRFLPLYLHQLRALGFEESDFDEPGIPKRLPDAVLARLERLEIGPFRLLQNLAVLGDSVRLDSLLELAREDDALTLERLISTQLVRRVGLRLQITHPFVRDLVESGIPAALRKELHASALQITAADGGALEVRAEHAWRSGDPMSALLLLERMGSQALRRGDGQAAVLAFRRGLELARRELLMTGDASLDRAVLTFSRKLGDAMDRTGDTMAADGVLREVLALTGPASRERLRMLVCLSRVVARRGRHADARRFLEEAMALAAAQNNRPEQARGYLALARLHHELGELEDALGALAGLAGITFERPTDDEAELRIEAALLEAAVRRTLGDHATAMTVLEGIRDRAQDFENGQRLAEVLASLADTLDASEHYERARELYRDAAARATALGDAASARHWIRRGRESGSLQSA